MSLRRQMLQVARVAPQVLGEASGLVAGFVAGQWHADGGACDRAGASDLYYTVFGLECLQALQRPLPPALPAWLARFGDGAELDFVHRCCLARALSITGAGSASTRETLAGRIRSHRSRDGGFHPRPDEANGSAYASYLALGALQDLDQQLPDPAELAAAIGALRAADGGWANQPGAAEGTTPTTVSAVLVLHACGRPPDRAAGDWLLRCRHPGGGFCVHPQVPLPDLLSTATALHALACLERTPTAEQTEADLDFIDSLWTNAGSFHGNWVEEALDLEYTYYGLLALGHLGLVPVLPGLRR